MKKKKKRFFVCSALQRGGKQIQLFLKCQKILRTGTVSKSRTMYDDIRDTNAENL